MIEREDLLNESDDSVWDFIGTGKTKTIFQLEKSGAKWAKQIKPRNIRELADLIAVIRPGCISEDCMIVYSRYGKKNLRISMKELYQKWIDNKIEYILSYDQKKDEFVKNKIKNIFPTGQKQVWKINARRNIKTEKKTLCQLICTDDHPILTSLGWKEAGKLKNGDRIAVVKASYANQLTDAIGIRSYRQICFENYLYKCIFCHWTGGTLDVNHIVENKKLNNSPDNLCFLCPNHHRMFTENIISTEEINVENKKHRLKESKVISWYEYIDKEDMGTKETYDISMKGPFHNFIAGNTIVHNCTDAELDGKSLTQVYADRKNGLSETKYIHPSLEPILKDTYGILIYQEQAMRIAMDIGGFTEQKADELRKAAGKKDVALMNKLKEDFVQGAIEKGVVSQEIAEQIYEWIQASSRYSFNLSHAVGYAYLAYHSAYAKKHDLIYTLAVNLTEAHNKPFKMDEIKTLIMDCKRFGLEVYPPSLLHMYENFTIDEPRGIVYYGASHIKNVGSNKFKIVKEFLDNLDKDITKVTWMDILIGLDRLDKEGFNALVSCNALTPINSKISRNQQLYEYRKWKDLTQKEKDFIKENKVSDNLLENIGFLINNAKINSRRIKSVMSIYDTVKFPPRSLEDDNLWIANTEEEYMGCALTCSKVNSAEYASEINLECHEISSGECGPVNNVCIGVKINSVNEYKITKEGKSQNKIMCFMSVEDASGELRSVTLFPEEYQENKKLLFSGNMVLLYGDVNNKKGELSFVVKKVKQI